MAATNNTAPSFCTQVGFTYEGLPGGRKHGKGEAGKTSLVRRLKELESPGAAPAALPARADRTIGIEMTTLQSTFVVHDFGGQPEYYPWHKLFLTPGALYAVVVDLADGGASPAAREAALLEQLDILHASVPGAVVIVVGTKADLVGAGGAGEGRGVGAAAEAGVRLAALEEAAEAWLAKRAQAAAAVEAAEDAAADQPPLIARFLMASADATNGFGIDDVSAALNEVARGQEPRRLFPRFEAPVPMVWERARGMLEAVKSGRDAAAAFLEPPHTADAEEEEKAEATAVGAAARAEIKRHHVPRAEVVALWNAALAQYPALAQDELAGTTAEQTLDDALNYLEGEGAVLQSHMSAIVHLNPPWLAETVRLGSQSQKQTRGRTDAKLQPPNLTSSKRRNRADTHAAPLPPLFPCRSDRSRTTGCGRERISSTT